MSRKKPTPRFDFSKRTKEMRDIINHPLSRTLRKCAASMQILMTEEPEQLDKCAALAVEIYQNYFAGKLKLVHLGATLAYMFTLYDEHFERDKSKTVFGTGETIQ